MSLPDGAVAVATRESGKVLLKYTLSKISTLRRDGLGLICGADSTARLTLCSRPDDAELAERNEIDQIAGLNGGKIFGDIDQTIRRAKTGNQT